MTIRVRSRFHVRIGFRVQRRVKAEVRIYRVRVRDRVRVRVMVRVRVRVRFRVRCLPLLPQGSHVLGQVPDVRATDWDILDNSTVRINVTDASALLQIGMQNKFEVRTITLSLTEL